jgi:cytidylate kinase
MSQSASHKPLPPVITIDGASGTGKGVVGHLVAEQLGWNLLDSGAIYRVLAYAAQKHGVALDNEAVLEVLAEQLDVKFVTTEISFPPKVFLESEDVTEIIRNEAIGNAASKVGVLAQVRTALLSRQRDFRQFPGLVTDGRDMGTVIFPDAIVKVFLTASPEERARRRYNQLKERNVDVNLVSLIEELRERDRRDQERAVAPLRPAPDALMIATDDMTVNQVVERIMSAVKKVYSTSN